MASRGSARHDTDIVSLVAGLLFLGVVGAWALDGTALLPGSRGWLLPIVLVTAGVVGLLSSRPGRRRRDAIDDDEPARLP